MTFGFYQPVFNSLQQKNTKIQYDILWFYKKKLFSKHQNKAEFKTLDDFELIDVEFSGLKTSAASLTSSASLRTGLNCLYIPIS